ncbi:MAG: squalene--hopene cyclase [Gammaproteobacteria bacterium]
MTSGATPFAADAKRKTGLFSAVVPTDDLDNIEAALHQAQQALLAHQHSQGYWSYELEADCTIPAEYILMMHYMGEIDTVLQGKISVYLRARQTADGGWPLYYGGRFDMSCSVKVYYALKLADDSPQAPHMATARAAILKHGGAARANVFTRISLALFGQLPWRGVPFIPVEVMLLPRWFPFHISKVSYWSRTVMVPLLILCSLKPPAKNPRTVDIHELFTVPPEQETDYFPIRSKLNRLLLTLSKTAHTLEFLIPNWIRRLAVRKAEAWLIERLNGTGGLGAIFPAMVNAYEALACLGYAADHPYRQNAKAAIDQLLVIDEHAAYCQPCVSPVWDTALACLALQEAGGESAQDAARRALDWLKERQLLEAPGDWREYRPELQGGGWPFQFDNSYYPDLDDTAAVVWAMSQTGDERYAYSVRRAADWLCGMQSCNGGFGSFDADNTHYYLNEIPFADHGALLDPATADVSARCVTSLAHLASADDKYKPAMDNCLEYLRSEQEPTGAWFGRWGTNYIYGSWSVLVALERAGISRDDFMVRRAVAWLKAAQREDGGWGEDNFSYFDAGQAGQAVKSTSFQTAWAMLGLMAGGAGDCIEVRRGAEYLLRTQNENGLWRDDAYTAPGFPRVFYLKYHGYDKYFPFWALARYRKLLTQAAL